MARPPVIAKDFQKPKVVFQPEVRQGMQRGINQIINAIRPTLGPLPRTVAIERIARTDELPELLDSGGTIARRIIQIEGRDEDVGAMFIRHVLWELQEKVGDGTATAAVMFQSIYNQGVQHIVNSGGNAMRMRTYFERCLPPIFEALNRQTRHLEGKHQLAQLAATIINDPPLAKMLGEIFDVIGAFGRLEIRQGRSRELEREYVEGMYWDSGWFSREMMNNPQELRADLEDAWLFISDLEINEPAELMPLLEMAVNAGVQRLVIIASTLSDRAMSLLTVNRDKITILGVKSPEISASKRQAALQDLAILTGGTPFFKAAGDTLNNVRPEHLGRARRVWANRDFFGVIGGRGDPRRLRQHLSELRKAFSATSDKEARDLLLTRIGRLMGGSATLWVGDITPTAIEQRKELAIRAAEAMRGAMREGVVPGGGIALLACREAIRPYLAQAEDPDEKAVYRILMRALETPARTLWQNAGFNDIEIMADLRFAPPNFGLDVVKKRIISMAEAGIWDAATVVKAAVHSAVAGAALALTTDVIIHRRRPPESMDTA
jgi:chaperonin GroEL